MTLWNFWLVTHDETLHNCIDFIGPLPSANNPYLLTVVDEYSRFLFAFPCQNMHTKIVIKCLESIFVLCGMPNFANSDLGASFMSRELHEFVTIKGVSTSRNASFHPIGNGQCERYNGIIWKSIQLKLKSCDATEQY